MRTYEVRYQRCSTKGTFSACRVRSTSAAVPTTPLAAIMHACVRACVRTYVPVHTSSPESAGLHISVPISRPIVYRCSRTQTLWPSKNGGRRGDHWSQNRQWSWDTNARRATTDLSCLPPTKQLNSNSTHNTLISFPPAYGLPPHIDVCY
jgi:hypothetical protein